MRVAGWAWARSGGKSIMWGVAKFGRGGVVARAQGGREGGQGQGQHSGQRDVRATEAMHSEQVLP